MSEDRKVNLVVAAENQTKQTFGEIKQDAASMASSVEQSGKRAAAGIESMGEGGTKAAGKMDGATRSIINSIQRATATIEAGEKGTAKYFETLAKQRNIGGDALEPYLAQMRKAEAAQAAAAKGLGNMEMSAKQTAAAMRGVPAQITDIVVSLQGGQAPLTVMLQQGGQLKDMFGGVGAAAKALGASVAGMISPLTAVAAGVAVLAAAYKQGSSEADAFSQAMITTGNSSGVTAGQLRRYAGEISQVEGTHRKAVASLASFVSAGVQGGEQLKQFAQTALEWEKATGQSVEKTAEQFASLQKDPLTAVLKLNEGTNFLTASVFEQIKALDDQGKSAEASRVAMDALNSSMRERSAEIKQNLGYIEAAWAGIAGTAAKAWDKMLNLGRAATLEDQLSVVQGKLDSALANQGFADTAGGAATGRVSNAYVKQIKENIDALNKEKFALMDKIDAQRVSAAAEEEATRVTKAKIVWQQSGAEYTSNQAKMERELAISREQAAAAGVTGGALEERLAAIRDKYKEKTKGATAATKAAESTYKSLMSTINEKTAAMEKEAKAGEKQTEAEKLRVKYQEELSTKGKQLNAQQRANIEGGLKALEAAEKQAEVAKALAKAWEDDAKSLEAYIKKQEALISSVLSSTEKLRVDEEAHILAAAANISHAEAVERLTIARLQEAQAQMQAGAGSAEEIDRINREIAARKELLGLLGQKSAREANKKAQEQIARDWEKTASTIGQTLSDYIMGGGKDAAQYLKRLFATLVLQPIVNYGVQGVLGAIGMGGGSAGGSNAMGMLNNLSSLNTMYSAFSGSLTNSVGTAFSKAGQLFGSEALKSFGAGTQGAYLPAGVQGPVTGGSGAGIGASGVAAVAAVVAGMVMSNKLFAQGYSANNFSSQQKTWDFGTYYQTKIASNIFGEKWANVLSGAPLGNFIWNKFGVTSHAGAASEYHNGAAFGDATTAQNLVNAGDSYIKSMQSTVDGLAFGIGSALDGLADRFGKKSGFYVGTGFTSDGKDPSSGHFNLTTPDGMTIDQWTISRKDPKYTSRGKKGYSKNAEAGYDEYLMDAADAALRGVFDLVPDWADDMVASVRDSLGGMTGAQAMQAFQGVVGQIYAVKEAFKMLGESIGMFADISGDVESILLRVSGGMEALTQNASTYYDLYYSDQEKQADAVRRFNEAIASYGVTLPATREEYRKLIEQQMAAGESGAELAAVLLKLSGDFASISDVWTAELGLMSASVSDFFSGLHGNIASAFQDVADSRKDILRGTGVMTASEIEDAIRGATIVDPSRGGLDAAAAASASAEALLAQRQQNFDAASDVATTQGGKLSAANSARDSVANQLADVNARIAYLNWDSSRLWDGGSKSGYSLSKRKAWQRDIDAAMAIELSLRSQLEALIKPLETAAAQQQTAYDDVAASAKAAADALAQAKEALAESNKAELQAKADYAAEVAKWIEESNGSVAKLSDLRGEVVSFYEAQIQAVQAMLQSAGNIRGVVDQLRLGQLTTAQTAAELGNRYAMDYAMALATTGSTRAGYVDAMAGNLGGLTEALRAEAVTGADWRIETAKLFAQANNAAGLLEGDAESDDYKDVALGLLDSIDTALAGLSGSTKSAEQVIADAISAGTEAQLSGLRAIVAALKGESIPAFATGGTHLGGLRIVGENGPELEATGPSRIWNAQQTAAMFSSGGGNTAALIAEIRELRADQRAQASKMVQLQQDMNRMLARWDSQGMPEEREVA